MVSRSRMPPPSWMGIAPPMARTIAFTAVSFTGLPANAPFRSTRCSRRAPASSHRRAIAAGSSLKLVADFISPCSRRTQWPSLRSMAGINSMTRAPGSGRPVQEVAIEPQTEVRALLGVELSRENVIPRHRRGKAGAVLGGAGAVAGVRRRREETVHEVEPALVRDARPQRMRPLLVHAVPSHLGHLVAAAVVLELALEAEAPHMAGDEAEAG